MSLINQPIFRKGLYIKPVSNRFTWGSGSINTDLAMGASTSSGGFSSFDGTKIIINETSKYRITYNLLSSAQFSLNPGAYFNFNLSAGSSFVGVLSGFINGTVENDNFGRSSYYTIANDTLNTSIFSISSGGGSASWNTYLNGSTQITLNATDVVKLNIQVTNMNAAGSRLGFNGFIFLEQIS